MNSSSRVHGSHPVLFRLPAAGRIHNRQMRRLCKSLVGLLLVPVLHATAVADDARPGDRVLETKVLSLFKSRCGECHGGTEKKSGLSVSSIADLLAGGATRGAAIVPGHPEESVLVKLVSGKLKPRMPFQRDPLSVDEIALITSWIKELKDARDPAVD